MEYLTDIDEFQAALKKVNVNEDMNVTKSNNVLLEGVELDCYHKCQKILDTPEMKKCHKRCLDVNFDELNESDIDTINELYDLGIERGLIDPDTESKPEDNPEDQMDDQNVQEPLKDVGDGCELDDVDGDAYWDMKKALRECGEYGSIDKSIEEEIMDEEYPMGDDEEKEIQPDEQIPEDEDPTMSEDPQSDEMTPPDSYDDDELIAALDDKDVAPSDSDVEKMTKDAPPVNDKDMPFEAEGNDTESDSEDASVADDSSTEGDGDEVQDASTDDTEAATDDGEDEVENDTVSEPEEDSTDDTETADTTDTETPADDSSDDTSTEDSDAEDEKDGTEEEKTSDDEKEEDSTEDGADEDKPDEKDLTADDKAQLKNEYTNMFSDIVKGMLSEVEPEDGKNAELCVKDMTPEQKSEFWGKVAEQWEGKADPADFMSASELESLEKQVEKKEKEESSKED